MPITRMEIAASLASWPPERLWQAFLNHGRTLGPFWEGATRTFAQRLRWPDEKRNRHLAAIASAFDRMDDWRHERVKRVRARRDEIDSAISFIRNRALDRDVSILRVAPAARNAAGTLRSLVYTSWHGYDDHQMPELIAGTLYDSAAVRTLFPFDIGDLVGLFSRGSKEEPGLDPFIEMLRRVGPELQIEEEVSALFAEVERLWAVVESPPPCELPESVWSEEGGAANAQLHFAAVRAFHR